MLILRFLNGTGSGGKFALLSLNVGSSGATLAALSGVLGQLLPRELVRPQALRAATVAASDPPAGDPPAVAPIIHPANPFFPFDHKFWLQKENQIKFKQIIN